MQIQTVLMTSEERKHIEKNIRDKKKTMMILKILIVSGLVIFGIINYFLGIKKFYYYFAAMVVWEIIGIIFITRMFNKKISFELLDLEKGIKEIITGTVSDIDKKYGTVKIEDRKLSIPVTSINSVKLGNEISAYVAKESGFPLKIEIIK